MDAQQAGTFDKKAFIAAVKAAIEAKSPKTLKEADNYKESGKAGEVKGEVKGLVTAGKEGQAKDIEAATEAPARPVKGGAQAGHPDGPGAAGRDRRRPGRRCGAQAGAPAEQTEPGGRQAAGQPGDGRRRGHRAAAGPVERAGVRAGAGRQEGGRRPRGHRPGGVPSGRAAGHRSRARRRQRQTTAGGVAGMQGAKGAALAKLVADKGKTKTKDEAKRAEVTTKITSIFTATEAEVKKILDGIDPKVEKEFNDGEAQRPGGLRELCRGQDVGVQEGSVQRLARRSAVGQGQAGRDARQGQRVLRGRSRALPQADGRRHLPGGRHRRR